MEAQVKDNGFAEGVITALLTPAKILSGMLILLAFVFVVGGSQSRITTNLKILTDSQIDTQGQLDELTTSTSMTIDEVRLLDSEVKKNQAIAELIHAQQGRELQDIRQSTP